MKPLAGIVIGTLRKSRLMRIPTRMGNTSWTTYWFLIMLEEKPPWYEATTWAVITRLLTQIFVWSIKIRHMGHCRTHGIFTERIEYENRGGKIEIHEAKDLCWMDNEARGKALSMVEEVIYSHSVEADSNNAAMRQWNNLQEHGARVEDLRKLLRQEAAGEIRKEIRRDIRREVAAKVRLLKGEQLDKLISGYFLIVANNPSKCSYRMDFRRAGMTGPQLHMIMAEKYCDAENDETAQRERLIRLQ